MSNRVKLGEGLVGQCAIERQKIILTDVPQDYITIRSGLGESRPLNIIVIPILFEGQVKAVLEMASFNRFVETHQTFLDQLGESIGIVLNTIEADTRTENLLTQSQSLARKLQSQQEELKNTNNELAEKARMLEDQKAQVEAKNQEVEHARRQLEEKARQLAITSKYKSEFLANMSHELRTPLNSLLLLSEQLMRNRTGLLSVKEIELAETIHSSGEDLLNLINDILDLCKIESGTVSIEMGEIRPDELAAYLDRIFRPLAESHRLDLQVDLAPDLPDVIRTDVKRLQQILRNLLSNAIKFTDTGGVTLSMSMAQPEVGRKRGEPRIAFRVNDTGIGISPKDQQIIFEAFQQVDGSTSRRHGGTGLGLSISRELAALLGADLQLTHSEPGKGSTFTLYLPITRQPISPREPRRIEPLPKRVADASPAAARTPREAGATDDERHLDGVNVLIVDDDERNVFALSTVLESYGVRVVTAVAAREAIDLLRRTRDIDLVVMDIMMPEMDGYQAIAAIRRLETYGSVPIVAVTAKVMAGDRERCMEAGASDYLAKPVDSEQLLRVLRRRLRLAPARPARDFTKQHSD